MPIANEAAKLFPMIDAAPRMKKQGARETDQCPMRDRRRTETFNSRARYDPAVMPALTRNKLSDMIDELNGVLSQIEGSR